MNNTSKTAIGSMLVALSVVVLIPSALEIFVYALPAFAGALTVIAVAELDKKWAMGVYFATSVISLIIVPNKEAVIMYVAFFGYYGIIKSILESSKLPRAIEYILKFLLFNGAIILGAVVSMKVLGLSFNEYMEIDQAKSWTKYIIPITLGTANIAFVPYDILLSRIVTIYMIKLRGRIHKMFHFK